VLYIASFLIWLVILGRNDLSVAYPIAIGLTLAFSTLAASIVIGEGDFSRTESRRFGDFFRNLARDSGPVLQNVPVGRIETHGAIGKLPRNDRHRARQQPGGNTHEERRTRPLPSRV
jgi:hypothetical protein